jgi:hypothetical protein
VLRYKSAIQFVERSSNQQLVSGLVHSTFIEQSHMEPVFTSPVVGIPAAVLVCIAHSIVESIQAGGKTFYHIKMKGISVPDRKAFHEALTNLGLPGIKSRTGYLCLHCLQCNVADPLRHIGGRGLNCSLVYLQDGTTPSEMQGAASAALVSAKSRTMRDLVTNSTAHVTQCFNAGLGNLEAMLKAQAQAQAQAQVQAQVQAHATAECQSCYGDFVEHITCQAGLHAYCYECYEGGLRAACEDYSQLQNNLTCVHCPDDLRITHPPCHLMELYNAAICLYKAQIEATAQAAQPPAPCDDMLVQHCHLVCSLFCCKCPECDLQTALEDGCATVRCPRCEVCFCIACMQMSPLRQVRCLLVPLSEFCVQDGWAERHHHARTMHPDGANFPSVTGSCFLDPDFIIRCQRQHSLPKARALLNTLTPVMRIMVIDRCLTSAWITTEEAEHIRAWYANPDPEDPADPEHPEDPADPDHPAHPADPDHPAHPADPEHPEHREHPWTCETCTFHNVPGSVICGVCEALAPGVWQCPICTLVVHEQGGATLCPSCGHMRTRKRKQAI